MTALMILHDQFRLAVVSTAISLAVGCAPNSGAEAPRQADAVAFEQAAPLELEPGSYVASQRDHYNRIYARPESERPPANEFLMECLERIDALNEREQSATAPHSDKNSSGNNSSPTALDIAMGDGRNTIALAQRGYRTVGFDFSDVGVNRARRRAAELGLAIDARVDTFRDEYLREAAWDVVAMMYFSVGGNQLQRIKQSVKPGGHMIIEFAGHYPTNDTLRDFLDWQIIVYEMDFGHREWASKQPNPGPGIRTRLLVRRPVGP
jgi:SAM-dependent methyltransferase